MSTEAQRWLDAALAERPLDPAEGAVEALCQSIRAQSRSRQAALLKACVERLPVLRARADPNARLLSSVLYGVACALSGARLPYRERDLCDSLRQAQPPSCGHGEEVTRLVDAAFDHARQFGISAELIDAMRAYVQKLTGATSSKAKHVKRRAALCSSSRSPSTRVRAFRRRGRGSSTDSRSVQASTSR
jgi:hypothetical protein